MLCLNGSQRYVQNGKIVSLKHLKKEVRQVRKGLECGVIVADYAEAEAGDIFTFYEMVPKKPSLYDALDADLSGP